MMRAPPELSGEGDARRLAFLCRGAATSGLAVEEDETACGRAMASREQVLGLRVRQEGSRRAGRCYSFPLVAAERAVVIGSPSGHVDMRGGNIGSCGQV